MVSSEKNVSKCLQKPYNNNLSINKILSVDKFLHLDYYLKMWNSGKKFFV